MSFFSTKLPTVKWQLSGGSGNHIDLSRPQMLQNTTGIRSAWRSQVDPDVYYVTRSDLRVISFRGHHMTAVLDSVNHRHQLQKVVTSGQTSRQQKSSQTNLNIRNSTKRSGSIWRRNEKSDKTQAADNSNNRSPSLSASCKTSTNTNQTFAKDVQTHAVPPEVNASHLLLKSQLSNISNVGNSEDNSLSKITKSVLKSALHFLTGSTKSEDTGANPREKLVDLHFDTNSSPAGHTKYTTTTGNTHQNFAQEKNENLNSLQKSEGNARTILSKRRSKTQRSVSLRLTSNKGLKLERTVSQTTDSSGYHTDSDTGEHRATRFIKARGHGLKHKIYIPAAESLGALPVQPCDSPSSNLTSHINELSESERPSDTDESRENSDRKGPSLTIKHLYNCLCECRESSDSKHGQDCCDTSGFEEVSSSGWISSSPQEKASWFRNYQAVSSDS